MGVSAERSDLSPRASAAKSTGQMEPTYLPAVENNPKPGPYYDNLQAARSAGGEYPQIWHLFAFRPEATEHLAKFTQEVMRGTAPLEPWLRELIAAYTSRLNDCRF